MKYKLCDMANLKPRYACVREDKGSYWKWVIDAFEVEEFLRKNSSIKECTSQSEPKPISDLWDEWGFYEQKGNKARDA